MAKSIRKPKLKKFPKEPKKSSSVDVWDNYVKRVKEIEKENDAKMAEYNKKVKAQDKAKAEKERKINEARKIKKSS